jgi:hypothetical protein
MIHPVNYQAVGCLFAGVFVLGACSHGTGSVSARATEPSTGLSPTAASASAPFQSTVVEPSAHAGSTAHTATRTRSRSHVKTPINDPNFWKQGVLVAYGEDAEARWRLYAFRYQGAICERDEVESKTLLGPRGGAGGCDYYLPIDYTEETVGGSGGPSIREVSGPVTLDAVSVRVDAAHGHHWTVTPQGGRVGFGRAFYIVHIPTDTELVDMVALDAHGREIGRPFS